MRATRQYLIGGILGGLLGLSLMPATFTTTALAQTAATGPVYVATYFEVAAASAKDGAKLLTAYRDASRK